MSKKLSWFFPRTSIGSLQFYHLQEISLLDFPLERMNWNSKLCKLLWGNFRTSVSNILDEVRRFGEFQFPMFRDAQNSLRLTQLLLINSFGDEWIKSLRNQSGSKEWSERLYIIYLPNLKLSGRLATLNENEKGGKNNDTVESENR